MEEHRSFDSAVEHYERWNSGPYSHAEHVAHVRDVSLKGQRLLHALGAEPAHYKQPAPTHDALLEAATWALAYFEHYDTANAAVHCAPVRYSPITFRLARALNEVWPEGEEPTPELFDVLNHDGAYPEDTGR